MKIKEITNAQDQLELLRTIIDNTWTSIKQQADTQARQASTKQVLNKKVKTAPIQKAPYAAPPKPLPKPKPLTPIPQTMGRLRDNNALPKPKPISGISKETPTNNLSSIDRNRSEREKQEIIKMAKGETPWRPL